MLAVDITNFLISNSLLETRHTPALTCVIFKSNFDFLTNIFWTGAIVFICILKISVFNYFMNKRIKKITVFNI